MTLEEIRRIAPDKAQAKCLQCGHNWKLQRGDAFLCPYCLYRPEKVKLTFGYMEFQEG